MSNSQWKSFQPPSDSSSMNDSNILDYKTNGGGNKSQSNFFRPASSRFDFPILQPDKNNTTSNNFGGGGGGGGASNNGIYGNSRFPIGTFTLESTSSSTSNGTSSSATSIFNNSSGGGGGSNDVGIFSTTNGNNDTSNNQGTRETGIIEKLLHSYGFIQCCERQARLFFHFSQFSGNIEHLKIGDPVEFEMTYDRRTGKPIASAVTKIAPEVVMSEERVTGTVTTEVRGASSSSGSTGDGGNNSSDTTITGRISYENRGECFFLPYTKDDVEGNVTLRSGDKVSFQIATNNSPVNSDGDVKVCLIKLPFPILRLERCLHRILANRGNLGACHVRLENPAHPVKYQGVVCSMKESFGFIERADVVKEIFFHFSEAKTKEELRLGDDVEFTIQTRNGKEVACNITRLPPGTVIFEDLKPEILKGQVLKPLDRGPNARHQTDALPGRIRYRAPDHSEVEISFGDKDQKGDFTLRHGDWVQFKVATDRRDGLNRATHISLLDESFVVSGEKREQGVVVSLKDGFGFLRCVERESRLFFHFNEVLEVEHEVVVGDEFEFTVVQDQTLAFTAASLSQSSASGNHRQSAIRMKLLAQGVVCFETRVENDLTGIVTKEAALPWATGGSGRSPTKSGDSSVQQETGTITYDNGGGSKKTIAYYAHDARNNPRVGDKVEFNVNQVRRNKELIAVDVVCVQQMTNGGVLKPPGKLGGATSGGTLYQGFVAALKDGFGFIETIEHDREVFFHFSNYEGDSNVLELGQEVEYNLGSRGGGGNTGTCSSAENVKAVPRGTIELPSVMGEPVDGTVVRPLRSVNPDQPEYSGLIEIKAASPGSGGDTKTEYEFGIMGLVNKRELLQVGDHVQLQIDSQGRASNIVAVRKKLRAQVDAIKGHFGFLAFEVDEGKKLFFHMTEVRDNMTLQVGDTVEFVLVTNQRSGKSSACSVVKVSDVQARPERLISRLRTVSLDESGPKLMVVRQPKGPDGTRGFAPDVRSPRNVAVVVE